MPKITEALAPSIESKQCEIVEKMEFSMIVEEVSRLLALVSVMCFQHFISIVQVRKSLVENQIRHVILCGAEARHWPPLPIVSSP